MKKIKVLFVRKKTLCILLTAVFTICVLLIVLNIYRMNHLRDTFLVNYAGTIIIDPGHGGIDGGAGKDGVLEKDVNLDISIKLKNILEQRGYKVLMTRDKDVSLESLTGSGRSRHQRDLKARVGIINSNNAQLFLSIHVNCNLKKPQTDGSIVFYNDKNPQNKLLALCIQRALNRIKYNGKSRTVHDPQKANFYIINNSKIQGVIVETAFISNKEECQLLQEDGFREALAEGICIGVEKYIKD